VGGVRDEPALRAAAGQRRAQPERLQPQGGGRQDAPYPLKARPTISSIAAEAPDTPPTPAEPDTYNEGVLPMIVLIIDELADLMMTVQGEVETPLAMLARRRAPSASTSSSRPSVPR
jgi:DNA segregation ATPase FtsK/SpoIIIE-like protein